MIILDNILNELVSASVSYAADKLKEEVALLVGVPEEIEKLKEHLVVINAVLADAEQRELVGDGPIKIWLDNLRDIVYDIEDVLEDVQEVLSPENEVKPGDNEEEEEEEEKEKVCFPSCIKKIKKIPRFLFKKSKEVKARHDIALRMEEINGRLGLIAKLKDEYKLEVVGRIDETRNERRMTTAFGKFVPNLAAQTAIRNQVAEKLRDNQDGKNVYVISLVGMGGIGKTTIARMVFNDEAIRAQFDKLLWVCVSDHFSEMKVAKAIAQDIVHDTKGVAELNQLHQVLNRINESIRSKKFFLVLDDVWTESNENWDCIFSCLEACLPGSKVLVTTRSHRVALKMKTDFKVPVNVLEEEECLLLFRHFAFNGRAEGECQSLESIAKEMAKRCKGLPLTAETLGKAMAYKSREGWNDVLGSKLWDFEDVEKGLLPALSISYIDLPSAIKRCFSYCSIFQKDEEIKKGDLIRIWMGLGFLSSKAVGSRKMEDVGEEYLNSLVARSFFQECKTEHYEEAVKMHDIIHDFAQYLMKNESLVFLGDGGGSRKIRHLNVPSRQAQLSTLSVNMEYLRTLFLRDGDSSDDDYSDVLLKLSRARVLKLNGSMICMIPSEIGKLTHLRYIDFSLCKKLKELPESICDLFALQTLDISECSKLEKLPKGIGKLIHLRHLNTSRCFELKELPESICDLSALEKLNIGMCEKLEKLPKGIGKLIGLRHLDASWCEELKELPESICDLFALQTLDISQCFMLEKLPKGIGKLIGLRHLDTSGCEELKELPESICDLSALEKLNIGVSPKLEKLPKGIGKLINLRHLKALGCEELKELPESICDLSTLQELGISGKLEKLPPLGRLPLLESLYLNRTYGVRTVGKELLGIIEEAEGVGHQEDYQPTLTSNSFVAFPKLRQLYFYDLTEWTTWADPEHDNNIQFTIMPSLLDLTIWNCPKLQTLPRFLAGAPIKKLVIQGCPLIEMSIREGCEGYGWVSDIPECNFTFGFFFANCV